MSRRINDERGLGVVAVVLLIVLAGLIGFVGWYIYQSKTKTNNILDKTSQAVSNPSKSPKTTAAKPAPPVDPTANWTAYSSAAGKYSLKYNPDWKIKECNDAAGTIFLSDQMATLGACNSGNTGRVFIYTVTDGPGSCGTHDNITTTAVTTAAGQSGSRNTWTETADGPGVPAGTKFVCDEIKGTSRALDLLYRQDASGPGATDLVSDFDLMVKNTAKIN